MSTVALGRSGPDLYVIDGGRSSVSVPVPRPSVRPGDKRDAIEWPLDAKGVEYARQAAGRGLSFEHALTLAIERHLVLEDARRTGRSEATIRGVLNAAAKCASIALVLPDAQSSYVQTLLRRSEPGEPQAFAVGLVRVPLPVRLLVRLALLDRPSLLGRGDLDESIAWEIAAFIAGRTMSEWALLEMALADYPVRR